jgi:hypothetical protein
MHEFRELTRTLTASPAAATAQPSADEIAAQLAALANGAATFSELRPVADEWRTAIWSITNPSHPFTLRFGRQRASGWFQDVARDHPDAITPATLAELHRALFDVSAAVAENTTIVLGLLGRPESREHVERFLALMAEQPGWDTVLWKGKWSLFRITDPDRVEPARGSADEPVLAVKRLGPDLVQLVQRNNTLLLRNPESGVEQAVSPIEANIFADTSEARLDRFFSGIENLSVSPAPSRLGGVAVGLMKGLPLTEVLATLTDTSTVNMARLTVEGLLRPEGLLDLSTLLHCCVFYDFVLVDADAVNVPEQLEGIVVPVRPFEAANIDPRWTIAVERNRHLQSDTALREKLENSWKEMLGKPVHIDFHSFDSITDSPGIRQYFPGGPDLGFYDPVDSAIGDSEQIAKSLDRVVSIQTFRYWINESVAASLGVAYNCTTLRYPVESVALAQRSAYLSTIDQLMSRVAPQHGRVLDQPSPIGYLAPVQVPNLLGIVLRKSRQREDIWAQVLELRKKFEPVRDFLREGRAQGSHDSDAFNRLMKKLFGKSAWDVPVDTAITVASTVASSTFAGPGAGVAALQIAAVAKPAGFVKRVVDRIVSPEVYVLRKFADDVALMNNELGLIERLWGASLDRKWLVTAARISQGSANGNRTLRQ